MVKVALTLVSLVSLIKPGLLVESWHSHGTGGESCYVYVATILLPKPSHIVYFLYMNKTGTKYFQVYFQEAQSEHQNIDNVTKVHVAQGWSITMQKQILVHLFVE